MPYSKNSNNLKDYYIYYYLKGVNKEYGAKSNKGACIYITKFKWCLFTTFSNRYGKVLSQSNRIQRRTDKSSNTLGNLHLLLIHAAYKYTTCKLGQESKLG